MSDKVGYLELPKQRTTMTNRALWGILFDTVWSRTENIPEIKYEVKALSDKVERQSTDIREIRDTLRGWEAQANEGVS
jgi:hypothetical protein